MAAMMAFWTAETTAMLTVDLWVGRMDDRMAEKMAH